MAHAKGLFLLDLVGSMQKFAFNHVSFLILFSVLVCIMTHFSLWGRKWLFRDYICSDLYVCAYANSNVAVKIYTSGVSYKGIMNYTVAFKLPIFTEKFRVYGRYRCIRRTRNWREWIFRTLYNYKTKDCGRNDCMYNEEKLSVNDHFTTAVDLSLFDKTKWIAETLALK